MSSSLVFFITVGIYLGILYGYMPTLQSQLDEVNDRIQKATQEISPEDQEGIMTFYSQLTNIKTLLGKHNNPSRLFAWLEEHTDPNIAYTKFSYTAETNQVTMTGVGKTMNDIVMQLRHFENQSSVKEARMLSVQALDTGGWEFQGVIIFKPEFLVSPAAEITTSPAETSDTEEPLPTPPTP